MTRRSRIGRHHDRSRLSDEDVRTSLAEFRGWRLAQPSPEGAPRLTRELAFPSFAAALSFATRIGSVADALDHHPDLHISWGRLGIELWTHDAGGISALDFELAREIDDLAAAEVVNDSAPSKP